VLFKFYKFRKFIKDYAIKTRLIQNLFIKTAEFSFGETCIELFILKKEFTSVLLLRLYDSTETELILY